MIELRWVGDGPDKKLEYRQCAYRKSNWGDLMSGYGEWSDWTVVPTVHAAVTAGKLGT